MPKPGDEKEPKEEPEAPAVAELDEEAVIVF